MQHDVTRRDFLHASAVLAAAGIALPAAAQEQEKLPTGVGNSPRDGIAVIASANGIPAAAKAAELLRQGADTLDAVIAGVNILEEDPSDHSVGLGGLPNEDGVVELDASVMHGPTCRAGAVAALRNIMHASKVAQLVMQRTDHVLIVGEGALRFARAHGFKEQDLLTDEARKIWLEWKETHSKDDDWLPPQDGDAAKKQSSALKTWMSTYGTINCCARDAAGNLSGVTTTSGLSYKIPGRVGDSPIIGAGLFVDNKVGAAGSTGRGEANLKTCGSHTVVEAMRHGMSPVEACLHGLKRIVETTTESRLRDNEGRPNFDVKYYALARDGRFGSASIWSGAEFAVFADGVNRLEKCAFLYERAKEN